MVPRVELQALVESQKENDEEIRRLVFKMQEKILSLQKQLDDKT